MALLKDGAVVEDGWVVVADDAPLPDGRPAVVGLERWQKERDALAAREAPVGVRLRSDQSPAAIADDVARLSLIELEFPVFKDGRAFSYARLLRERYGYRGELRAVGNVLLEQLLFMHRCGFDAFELESEHPVGDWVTATSEIGVFYQPTADGRRTAAELRRLRD